ncbi:MAG: ribonuclease HII [Candidatus Omnitrophota bacterium]
MLKFEDAARKSGYSTIIGVDEAGRGPLAGPVVVGAVRLKSFNFQARIDDSKKLSSRQRQAAFLEIVEKADYGVGVINEWVIDQINIANAVKCALDRAVERLIARCVSDHCSLKDTFLLMDGSLRSGLPCASKTIIGGDGLSLSIACASIVAKVIRDRIMDIYHCVYPAYGFSSHKGYGTKTHMDSIYQCGFSPIHRRTFYHGGLARED